MSFYFTSFTAESKAHTSLLGYCSQTHTLGELNSNIPARPVLGFCVSSTCPKDRETSDGRDSYMVAGQFYWNPWHTDKFSATKCDRCHGILFWTPSFRSKPAEEYYAQQESKRERSRLRRIERAAMRNATLLPRLPDVKSIKVRQKEALSSFEWNNEALLEEAKRDKYLRESLRRERKR